jgi:hypothetical protein
MSYEATYAELLQVIPRPETITETAAAASADPPKANQTILEGYVALSKTLGRLLQGDGEPPENATFATFAAWAALSLRREAVLDDTANADVLHPARRVYRWLANDVLDADDAIARNVVRGQAAIYEEIGSAIFALLQQAHAHPGVLEHPPDPEAEVWKDIWHDHSEDLVDAQEPINDGRDASEALDAGSVPVLQRAVTPYFSVLVHGLARPGLSREGRKLRAELILLANLRILAYEQKRLQPVFERNLAYVPAALKEMMASRLGRQTALLKALREPLDRAHHFTEIVGEAFQIAATRSVFSMLVGREDLAFGRDLPVPPPGNLLLRDCQPEADRQRYGAGAFFPSALANLQHPQTWAAWQLYDRSSGQGARTAVNNWLRYGERMNFIVNVFRSRQQLTALYDEPGSPTAPLHPAALGTADESPDAIPDRLKRPVGAES